MYAPLSLSQTRKSSPPKHHMHYTLATIALNIKEVQHKARKSKLLTAIITETVLNDFNELQRNLDFVPLGSYPSKQACRTVPNGSELRSRAFLMGEPK